MLTMPQLRSLPKIDLHRHLDCCMRWSTLVELAPVAGIVLPPQWKAQREQFLITEPMRDLNAVLAKFRNAQQILQSEEILTRLAFEACEDAFNDGVRVVEFRYAPTFIAEGHSNLSFEKIHTAIIDGIEIAKKKYPMAIGLICIIQRNKSLQIAESICDFAIEHKDTFVGLDLADDEEKFEPRMFGKLFQRAKKSGLHITIHSGEVKSPQAAQWVRDSVEILGAERIGHGVQIIHEDAVVEWIQNNNITLEICPISNFLTQAFVTLEDHPIRRLYERGVNVTINSDDPGIFGATLTDEYEVLQRIHGFKVDDFKKINQIAFESSFIDLKTKNSIWEKGI